MATPSNGHEYDPLPLTAEGDHAGDALYNAPPSPEPRASGFDTPRRDSNPLPQDDPLLPAGAAQPRFLGSLYDGPSRDSYASSHTNFESTGSDFNNSVYALNAQDPRLSAYPATGYRDDPNAPGDTGVPMSPMGTSQSRYMEEKRGTYAAPRAQSRRRLFMIVGGVAALVVVVAVVIAVYFGVVKHKGSTSTNPSSDSSNNNNNNNNNGSTPSSPNNLVAVTGGDGSTVTMEDGSTFVYNNSFGGFWYWDINDPLNNNAQAQSWSPPLNTTFNFGVDRVRGVNIGGWLVTEPFIIPSLYQQYANQTPTVVDEWTLSEAMTADTANGGLNQMETHYKTFITEEDFAQIAAAGLNWVRIPIAWWAIEVREGEPFLAKTSWTYFLKAVQWARKYGIRINLDLHAIPGSQNGWNHSGRLGAVNFLNGPMGIANAQRALDYIRILAEFVSQPEYTPVVAMLGALNEPLGPTIGLDPITSFYWQAYQIIRTASGIGSGNGPFISFHDGFFPLDQWVGFLNNADRIILDEHPYICFNAQSDAPMSSYATTPCTTWGAEFNKSMTAFGMTTAGEFSNAVTDCGLYLNGVTDGTRYDGTYADGGNYPSQGSCDPWIDYQSYTNSTKQAILQFALASMDSLQNYFFWTWKIGPSAISGLVESPAWSYQLGLQQGWMPTDPRTADGTCGNTNPWSPPLSAWQTGGSSAGAVNTASASSAYPWPPAAISNAGAVSALQTYTPTSALITMPNPTFATTSGATITPTATPSLGSGWENPSDTALMYVMPSGCSYIDPWIGPTAVVAPCTGS